MRDYTPEKFTGELKTGRMDSILFFLSDGDLSKIPMIRKSTVKNFYDYYYIKRLQLLNDLLETIARLRDLKQKEKKK